MQFETDNQKTCYEKVVKMMKTIFGTFAMPRENSPVIIVSVGSSFSSTAVYDFNGIPVISTRAYVVRGAEITQDLMRYLLEKNCTMVFGAFGIDKEGNIIFEHTICGDTCDEKELEHSVKAVVFTADRFDDEIVSRWGGTRALDRI